MWKDVETRSIVYSLGSVSLSFWLDSMTKKGYVVRLHGRFWLNSTLYIFSYFLFVLLRYSWSTISCTCLKFITTIKVNISSTPKSSLVFLCSPSFPLSPSLSIPLLSIIIDRSEKSNIIYTGLGKTFISLSIRYFQLLQIFWSSCNLTVSSVIVYFILAIP